MRSARQVKCNSASTCHQSLHTLQPDTTRYYQHLLNKWCLFFRVQWLDRTHWLNPRSQMDVRIFLDIGALQSHCSPHELHIKTYQNLKEKTIEIHRNPHIPGVPRLARKCIQVQWHLLLARILRNHPWLGKHGGSWGWFFLVLPWFYPQCKCPNESKHIQLTM